MRRDRLIPLVLAAGCYALALAQRPGKAVADTKIDLHVDPVGFLADVFSTWTPSTSLGHVWSGQYGGYLFPMGPFYALGHELGLGAWVTQRLWLGTLYALSAWGVVRLLDVLLERERGAAHVIAACAYVLNPYVLAYTSRVSITLLAYAALPWLLVCVHRGLRDGRGWAWPAAIALIVTASGGGVNAAVTAWVLLGPALLVLYEAGLRTVPWGAAWSFTWRTAIVGVVASLWWVLPLLVQSKYGVAFLQYTEQPGTIWQTTSMSESLRLMGFWLSYAGVGYGGRLAPYTSDAGVLVFWAPVVVASLLVPALALGSFAWTRRWRYGPFFLALVLAGVLVMFAGFPEGTPFRHGLTFAYNRAGSLQFLRTTYKAGPLVALGLAVLGGVGAGWLWRALPSARFACAVGTGVLLVLSSWPLWRGRAVDDQLVFDVPSAWHDAAADVDARLGDDSRAMVLPGQLFAHYTWGGTVDPILPSLTDKPVAVRAVVPFADLRSVDLQWTTDALISQRRALPGQLPALLKLQGVRSVITGADDDRSRSGALGAAEAARELALAGYPRADRAWGPVRRAPSAAGSLAPPVALPEVRRYDAGGRGLVNVLPRDGGDVIDGSADALAELATFHGLPREAPLRYAADLSPAAVRAAARDGARVVVSDSNRRRVFVPSRLQGNQGWTLAPGDPISEDGHQLNPWPDRGTDAQTVAQLSGVRYVRAPFSPQLTQFPEHRPYAAVDGDPRTAWLADRSLDADRWHLEVGLKARRDVPYLDLLPYGDERGRVKAVTVNGKRYRVHDGWNRLDVGLRGVDEVSVGMADVTNPPAPLTGGAGGIRELRIPGVRVGEALRLPVLAERALRGADLRTTPFTYLFSRTRADDPYHRSSVTGPWQAGLVRDRVDPEAGMERIFAPPAARSWTPRAWMSVAPSAPDDSLDRLAGMRVPPMTSSSRYEGLPGRRASRAFDGDPRTAWVGTAIPGQEAPWIAWRLPRARTVRALLLEASPQRVRRPTVVQLVVDGRAGPPLDVGPFGAVALPGPVRGRAFRLEILDARFPAGTPSRERQRRAVAIAEIRGAGLRAPARRAGPVRAGCAKAFTVSGRPFGLRAAGDVGALDAGRPLRARPCGVPVALSAGPQRLSAPAGRVLRIDDLALSAPAVTPTLPPITRSSLESPLGRSEPEITTKDGKPVPVPLQGGAVLDPGKPGRSSRDGVRVRVDGPAWLVLGQSYSKGWHATCDGKDLGEGVPIQGYANGWPVDKGCRKVDFAFRPQRTAVAGYVVSLVASLVLLALLLLRRRTAPAPETQLAAVAPDPSTRWPWRAASATGFAAALAGGFVFAIRAGVVIGPMVALILRYGLGPKRLSLAAGALLGIAVPVIYLAVPAKDKGGYGTNVPIERIAAHWVAVAAVVLLLIALAREISERRRASGGPRAAAPAPARPAPQRTAAPGPPPRTTPARTSPR